MAPRSADLSLDKGAHIGQSDRVRRTSVADLAYADRQSQAFPSPIRDVASDLIRGIPMPDYWHEQVFTVTADGEDLTIPYRIYNPEPTVEEWSDEASAAYLVRLCFYSRHNDGFVRQRAVRGLLRRSEAWIAPHVVRLVESTCSKSSGTSTMV